MCTRSSLNSLNAVQGDGTKLRILGKVAIPPLPSNKTGSLKRLASLVQRLKRNGKLDYDAIIQQQLEEGVVEEAEEPAQVKEFYILHKAVIRESSETRKMRIVYDASARAYDAAPSFNECLESEPPLQNQLWKVLGRNSEHKRKTGPLTTEEINYQKLLWEKTPQKKCAGLEQFEDDKLKLNLQMNHDGALECRGRIQGDYPVYLPDSEMYPEKLVQHAHEATLHGGVSLTMAKV